MATKGKVITVLGPVEPSTLGRTLSHEHFSLDFTVAFTPPLKEEGGKKINCDFSLPNLGWIRQNPYSHKGNIAFYGDNFEKIMEEELKEFAKNGGGCLVENTTHGIQRNLKLLKHLATHTDVKIVAGTGYYVAFSQFPDTLKMTEEAMAQLMTQEITEGCVDEKTIACGLLGELGCSWPLEDFERRNLRAAGSVQELTGCPVMFHPGRHHLAPQEIIRVYSEAGGKIDQSCMGHLDRTIHSLDSLLEFAELGSYLDFDLFGIETSHYQLNTAIDMPSDAQRVHRVKHLADNGFEEKVLIAHDIHTKHRLTAYGGHGFSHIFDTVVPTMLERGITQQQVDKLLIDNPSKWLTFTK